MTCLSNCLHMFRNSPRQFECSDLIFKARQRNKNKLRCWNIPDCAQHPQTCDVVFPITMLFKIALAVSHDSIVFGMPTHAV